MLYTLSRRFKCSLNLYHHQYKLSFSTQQAVREWNALPLRPPIVTIMGHVDHGKTTLLDHLRKTSLAALEAGGITQHIGAFSVELPNKHSTSINRITFLDTPGHAAFSRMRERGAKVTDIVVLVVAADDGVMAQTVESIRFAQKAQVPIVVAINKADKAGVNVNAIKEELLKYDVVCEDYGGDTQTVAVSGLTGLNMDHLLECLVLQGELLEVRADPMASVEGAIIESRIKVGLGECATMLVRTGTLRIGTILIAEDSICKVRRMTDHAGQLVKEGVPSMPLEVAGWRSLPRVGAPVIQVETEREAEALAEEYRQKREEVARKMQQEIIREREVIHDKMWKAKQQSLSRDCTVPSPTIFTYEQFIEQKDDRPVLDLLIKSDVIGSQEAIAKVLNEIRPSKVRINIVSSTVGPVTETDIENCKAIRAQIIVFNQKTPRNLAKMAEREGVKLSEFSIIYRLVDFVKEELAALLPLEYSEKKIGQASVLQLFPLEKTLSIAGCRVDDGTMIRSREQVGKLPKYFVQLIRDMNDVLWTGSIQSMRHLKKEINNAGKGMECGILLEGCSQQILPNDRIVCYERDLIKTVL